VHVEGVLEIGEHVLGGDVGERFDVRADLAPARAEPVDAESAGELRDPGADGVVLSERVEPLVDACEDVLENVLGILRRQPEGLEGDRVDVAREALDELSPGLVVAVAAAGDQGTVCQVGVQVCAARSRLAIVSRSFQAIDAFDSTRGRNSHEVRP
jgi:hypothetical protein